MVHLKSSGSIVEETYMVNNQKGCLCTCFLWLRWCMPFGILDIIHETFNGLYRQPVWLVLAICNTWYRYHFEFWSFLNVHLQYFANSSTWNISTMKYPLEINFWCVPRISHLLPCRILHLIHVCNCACAILVLLWAYIPLNLTSVHVK